MYNDHDSQRAVIEEAIAKLDSRLSEVLRRYHDSLTGKVDQLLGHLKCYMDVSLSFDCVNDEALSSASVGVTMSQNSSDTHPMKSPSHMPALFECHSDEEEPDTTENGRRQRNDMRPVLSLSSSLTSSSATMDKSGATMDKLFPTGRYVLRDSSSGAISPCFADTMVALFRSPTREDSDITRSRLRASVSTLFSIHHRVSVFVDSPCFDVFCGGIILLNTILIGVEAEYSSAEHGHQNLRLATVHVSFSVWYVFELLLRVFAFGGDYFFGQDWRWNWFDLFLVFTVLLDMALGAVSEVSFRVLRIARFFRIIRAVRLYRQLRMISEFRKMIYSIASSSMTLLWSFVLLFFMLYAFAVYVAGNVRDFTVNIHNKDHKDYNKLKYSFGSLWKSIYTLFQCISAGENWGKISDLLWDVDQMLPVLFCGFIFIIVFGALNVVMGVFVDSAMQSTQHYKDLLVQENQRSKDLYMGHIRNIFKEMDTDGSGTLSMEEMIAFLTDENLQLSTYFDALELNAFDAHALFRLLDDDRSGVVDIDEFCTGCMRLKGVAKSFDVHCGIYEMSRMFRNITKQLQRLEKKFKGNQTRLQMIDQKFQRLGDFLSQPRLVRNNIGVSNVQSSTEVNGVSQQQEIDDCKTAEAKGKVKISTDAHGSDVTSAGLRHI